MRHLHSLALAAVVFAIGCGDQPTTAPDAPRTPRFDISDGAHDNGNDGFFFLPPMVKEPVSNPKYKDESFHGGMRPRIEICELESATQCAGGEPFKRFASEQISVGNEQYQVNWDTKEKPLLDGKKYRIQVFIGDVRLGYADVEHAENRAELKNLDTFEFVPLVDGRTLPIRFRVESGALCTFNAVCTSTFVDKDVGGTVYAADEGAAIDFDPSVLPVDVVVTVERIPVAPGAPCVAAAAVASRVFLQWEGCYRISTTPDIAQFGGFQGPTIDNPARAIVAVCIEPDVPAGVRDNLMLHKFDEDVEPQLKRPEPVVPPFEFPCDDFAGTPLPEGAFKGLVRDAFGLFASTFTRLIAPRPLYAVDGGLGCILAFGDALSTFFWGLPVTAAVSEGNNQEALVGTTVPVSPEITVMTFHPDDDGEGESFNEPVELVPVTFTVTGGGGSLVNEELELSAPSVSTETNAGGVATLPSGWAWKLGNAPGTNTLVASGPFEEDEDGPPTFTAQGVAPDWVIESVTLAPASFPNTLDLLTFAIVVRNIGQTPTPATTVTFSAGVTGVATQTLAVGTLAPGAAQTVTTAPSTIGTAAPYVATATVDPSNGNAELDESNNSQSLSYTIGLPPDLTVESFTVSPASPVVTDNVIVTAVVRNDGAGTARTTDLMIDVGGESTINAPRFAVPPLGPGATHTVNRALGRMIAQTWINNAVADVGNATPETDETNNSRVLTFVVDGLFGSVSDASGDALSDDRAAPFDRPDLLSASIAIDGTHAHLQVRFASGAFSPSITEVSFFLDTDQNPSTGTTGLTNPSDLDAALIGGDYIVEFGSAIHGTTARITHAVRSATGSISFTRVTHGTVAFVANGMDVSIPLSLLGNDDGRMNFKVLSVVQVTESGTSGPLDFMTNVGAPVGVVARPTIIGSAAGVAWRLGAPPPVPAGDGI